MRQLFKAVALERMARLDTYGTPELGTVTGANDYFALTDTTRRKYGIAEKHLKRIRPARHPDLTVDVDGRGGHHNVEEIREEPRQRA